MSEIENELLSKSDRRRIRTKSRTEYLKSLTIEAAEFFPDPQWRKLSEDTKNWVNENVRRINDGKQLLDFNGKKVHKAKEPKKSDSNEPSGTKIILDYVISDPDITLSLVKKKLQQDDVELSEPTIRIYFYAYRDAVRELSMRGMLKEENEN